ncbi:MAG: HEAT repeat domain-containing protein [Deltaproteobacteria bacterium]|nr:HEAT repeat domain-containing protein [Deltaproteobacteria bacterium]
MRKILVIFALMVVASWSYAGSEEKLDQLIFTLKNAELGVERAGAAIELGDYKESKRAFDALLDALFDRDAMVVRYTIKALGKHAHPEAYPYFQQLLFRETPPAKMDLFTKNQEWLLRALVENMGKLGNTSVIGDVFNYFSRIPDVVKNTVFLTAGLSLIRGEALKSIMLVFRKFPRNELIDLYHNIKPLLLATTTILPPDFSLPGNPSTLIDKYAQEMAFFFLTALSDEPAISSEIFKVMVNDWFPDLRVQYHQNFIVYEEASEILLRGTLKSGGGEYGQFKLVDANGDTITPVKVSKERYSELKHYRGKEVVIKGKIHYQKDKSFFRGERHIYFINFLEMR